ncbi:Mediator of RNA polymerase II transcription subunit 23 [Camellia lanceoleosa]|uniref:Mediator of RNA polymerase II transcription subunit 23 n=1 Tax=Camellia lanceoleosa TaxID=1840588 RepID=A0ACC0FN81_9ERIC|nr:Mediator of RNA polymerase II transcription subunit 23 [Camellia lanceoleosa]
MYGSVKTNAQLSPTLKYIYVCIFVRTTKKGLAYESNPFKPASSSFISSVMLADIDATVLQPPIYGRGPPPGGMPMMPMLLPDGRIGCLSSNHASPMPSIHGIGSPAQSATEPLSGAALSPMKSSDITCTGQQSTTRTNLLIRDNAISSLCQLCCKIILTGLQSNLKPVTHADIFHHVLNWLVNWDQRQQGSNEFDAAKCWKPDKALIEWLHICLDVIWLLVEDDKCHVPFYELLRSGLQFIENIPDDEALFTLILEIHRWQDMMAMHMQMLDQHLHRPTFGNQRLLSQATTNVSGEAVTNMRYS